jgi:hypothetical protein
VPNAWVFAVRHSAGTPFRHVCRACLGGSLSWPPPALRQRLRKLLHGHSTSEPSSGLLGTHDDAQVVAEQALAIRRKESAAMGQNLLKEDV